MKLKFTMPNGYEIIGDAPNVNNVNIDELLNDIARIKEEIENGGNELRYLVLEEKHLKVLDIVSVAVVA